MIKLVCFGDSICFGQFVSPHAIWMNKLSATLSEQFGSLRLQNPSISGNTTRMALERMAYDVQAHGIDVFYTQFGMNDCNYWATDNGNPRVSAGAYRANLKEILARARASGAKVLMIGTNHPTPKITPYPYANCSYQESNAYYNTIIRETAAEEEITLIDHEAFWNKQVAHGTLKDYLLEDEIHLSLKGHDLYYTYTAPLFEQAIHAYHALKIKVA